MQVDNVGASVHEDSAQGQRFEARRSFAFGKNWKQFLAYLDEQRIGEAERSLRDMLETSDLAGKRFLDIGSGSGLFSLAARRLGASVHSFDYDPESVGCTSELKARFFSGDSDWRVEQASVLDSQHLGSLGVFDVVYSWGVLHHTGAMWTALENAASTVKPGGQFFIAIYNDQGRASRAWLAIKSLYNQSPRPARLALVVGVGLYFETRSAIARLIALRDPLPFRSWRERIRYRGMSPWHDLVDWVGGYPFEVAKPEEIFDFLRRRGFVLCKLKTCGGGLGCNEYVFCRKQEAEPAKESRVRTE